jgi:mycothiol synthase
VTTLRLGVDDVPGTSSTGTTPTPGRYSRLVRRLEVTRHVAEDDIATITGLLDASRAVDGRAPLSDHLAVDLASGGRDGFVGILAYASSPGASDDELIAYAQISAGNDADALELVVHPGHRAEAAIAADLLEAALQVVADDGGGRVNWWVIEPTSTHELLAAQAGMRPGRRVQQMRRSLPTGTTSTIATRSFVPGADDAAWLEVNNRAFAGHTEQGGWTLETLRARQREPWFDPEGFRILEHDGRIAGFCWTKVHEPDDGAGARMGEIYVIAVDPDHHGRGLGRQLTLAGLDHLAAAGITTGMLYVDAANTAAVRLYEQLGFRTHSTTAAFEADVAPPCREER